MGASGHLIDGSMISLKYRVPPVEWMASTAGVILVGPDGKYVNEKTGIARQCAFGADRRNLCLVIVRIHAAALLSAIRAIFHIFADYLLGRLLLRH